MGTTFVNFQVPILEKNRKCNVTHDVTEHFHFFSQKEPPEKCQLVHFYFYHTGVAGADLQTSLLLIN